MVERDPRGRFTAITDDRPPAEVVAWLESRDGERWTRRRLHGGVLLPEQPSAGG